MPIDPSSTRMHTEAVEAPLEPMLRIQSFYRMANALSVRLGRNPDRPPHLEKVTSTL